MSWHLRRRHRFLQPPRLPRPAFGSISTPSYNQARFLPTAYARYVTVVFTVEHIVMDGARPTKP